MRAASSTSVSREKFSSTASSFIAAIWLAPIMPFVESIAGTWIVM